MTAPVRPALAYRPELDGVRAIAVLAVLGFHLSFTAHRLVHLFRGGFLGVDIFFVLSGMLITELLVSDYLRNGTVSLGGFYRRRAQRLLPALATFLVIVSAYFALVGAHHGKTLRSLGTIVVYVTTGHLSGVFDAGISHVWTLVVEWEFYLIWPAVLALALRRGVSIKKLGYAAAATAVAITCARAALLLADGNTALNYYLAWLRFDELLVGCAVGLLHARPQAPSLLRTVALAGLFAVISQAVVTDHWLYFGGMLAIAICAAAVVQVREQPWWFDRVLVSPPMVWTGKLSYSLYLWSVPVVSQISVHASGWPTVLRVIACIVVSFSFAAASYYLVERRFRMPSRRPLTTDAPSLATGNAR
jgi:peptidoglycan/LPS O-acetylase OafA/YrhL